MADKVIEIVVDVRDATGGKVKGLQNQLKELDRTAQRLANRFKSFATMKYRAAIELIDRVTEPGNRINNMLKRLAGKAWRLSLSVTDSALGKLRQVESLLMRITSKAYNIAINVKDNVKGKLGGLMNGAAMGAGMFMPIAGMAGVGFGVANAVQAYAGFEKQMSKVQAIRQLDKNSDEMKKLYQQAKDLGATTAWTRQQVGEAQYYQALAGWSTENILKATPHLLNLASAADMDLGRTSDIVTDTMTAFNLKPTDTYINKQGKEVNAAEHYMDLLAKLQASSNTSVEQAYGALKYSANQVGALTMNLTGQERVQAAMENATDAAVMTALLANAGIKDSMAGTGMSNIMQRMTSGNRNAYYGLGLTDTEIEDAGHNLLPFEKIIKQLNKSFHEGLDVDKLANFVEEMSGQKINADTRRRLDKISHDVLENGGKMGTANAQQLATMLGGAEHAHKLLALIMGDWDAMEEKLTNVNGTAADMANTMRDNLAGSFTILGSAWDAFQQDLLEGTAGQGLRGFVDTLTELITRANKLFSDGIDIGDFGKIIGDVIGRLKNKFLELDGIGSILAGGALAAGLYKIISLVQKGTAALKAMTTAAVATGTSTAMANVVGGTAGLTGAAGRATAGVTTALPAVVTTMSRVSSDIAKSAQKARLASDKALAAAWGAPGSLATQSAYRVANARATYLEGYVQRQAIKSRVEAYNAEITQQKQAIALAREQSQIQRMARLSNMRGAAAGGAAFAGIFGLLDILSMKSANADRLAAATTEAERVQIARENRQAEWEAGAGVTGSVLGAAIGAGLGSFIGPLGTALGGIIGGMLGEYFGAKAGKEGAEREFSHQSNLKTEDISKYVAEHTQPTSTQPTAPPDYSFGQTQTQKKFEDYAKLDLAWKGKITEATQEEIAVQEEFDNWLVEHRRANLKNYDKSWQGMTTAPELYKANQTYDIDDLFFNKAHANELNEEQMAQMAAMERGEFYSTPKGLTESTDMTSATDMTSFTEQLYSDLEALQEGVSELFTGLGESITENLTSAFEGVGEVFTSLSESITEGLTSTFEGASELFSTFGETVTEGLTSTFEGAGELFSSFGEMISSGMDSALTAATGALEGIQSAFTSAKESIQSAWGELPGFFSGVFSGLGGAAEAAGSAIYSGLTAPIGSIIAAWQGAAAQISSIISSISAQAAAMPSVGGGIPAHAEGGFITSPEIALIGEKGAEAIIPLDGSQHALDLFKQTAAILGVDEELDSSAAINSSGSSSSGGDGFSVSVGGVNVNFEINGAENAQDVMQTIQENLESVVDKIAASLASKVDSCFRNQALNV